MDTVAELAIAWEPQTSIVPAGPGWWSGNTTVFHGTHPEHGSLILRQPRAHRSALGDPAHAVAFATALASAGLGPEVIASTSDGAIITRDIGEDHHLATLSRVMSGNLLVPLLAAHRQVGTLTADLPEIDSVDELARLVGVAARLGMSLPDGAEAVLQEISTFAPKLHATSETHVATGDAMLSNIMLGPDTSVAFVGGTLAGRRSRTATAGMLVAELAPYVAAPEEVFETFWGSWDARAYARAQLFGIIDDIRWAAISRIATARSTHPNFAPSFLGGVRVRHALATLSDPAYSSWKERA